MQARSLPRLVECGVAATLAITAAAHAAGPFDGTWTLSAPSVVGSGDSDNPACAALGIRFQIAGDQVLGNLERAANAVVSVPDDPSAGKVIGSVKPNGSLYLQWQGIAASGSISGDKLRLSWIGACGERTGTGRRTS